MKTITYKTILIFVLIALSTRIAISQNNVKPFITGEKLVYIAHMGWLNAGTAIFTIQDSFFEGQSTYHAKAQASTIALDDKIFKVYDF